MNVSQSHEKQKKENFFVKYLNKAVNYGTKNIGKNEGITRNKPKDKVHEVVKMGNKKAEKKLSKDGKDTYKSIFDPNYDHDL